MQVLYLCPEHSLDCRSVVNAWSGLTSTPIARGLVYISLCQQPRVTVKVENNNEDSASSQPTSDWSNNSELAVWYLDRLW